MFPFLKFLQKRPSDTTIRSIRLAYALGLASLLVLTKDDYSFAFKDKLGEWNVAHLQYVLAILVLIPGIVAALWWCVTKRTYVRIGQIIGSILIFSLAAIIVPSKTIPVEPKEEPQAVSISASDLTKSKASEKTSPQDISNWLFFLAFLPLISGITGKMVTARCLKHGEVITKIRV